MENKNSFSLSYNLVIAFVIGTYPVGPAGIATGENKPIGKEESSTTAGAISTKPSKKRTSAKRKAYRYTRTNEDLECLALNIYFEARSESAIGRRAVGHVVMNRVNHRKFPDSICDVVRQGGAEARYRCQFSWWCDGQSDKPYNRTQWTKAMKLAAEIYRGQSTDPTGGALWYHADYTQPRWTHDFKRGPKIGRHIFYQESRPKSNIL
jgi:spore germination cell wall hydrolase CwlJ-like protein